MSIIGTFSVMYLLHYSLDNLSLMALTLAVGFVVDDAIVMLENIVRHLEMGKPKMQAAIDGASEVGFTILSMTFSLAAVFIPFLFMGGIIGKLFHEFAVTIGVGDSRVGLRVAHAHADAVEPVPQVGSRQGARPSLPGDGAVLRRVARALRAHARLGDGSGVRCTLVFSSSSSSRPAYLFWSTPKGLFPTDDTGQLLATTEAAEGVSFDALVEHQQEVAAVDRARIRTCAR